MKNPVKYFSIIIRNDYGGKANSLAPGMKQTTKQAVHFFAIAIAAPPYYILFSAATTKTSLTSSLCLCRKKD